MSAHIPRLLVFRQLRRHLGQAGDALCIVWGCVAAAVPSCASRAAVVILSLTIFNMDWGTLRAGQCIAAARVFPAARNGSAYPAKLMVVERWCLWLTMAWVFLAAPSPGERSQGCVHPLVQGPGCEGEGWARDRLDGRMDGEGHSPGSKQLPSSFTPIFALLLLFPLLSVACSAPSRLA